MEPGLATLQWRMSSMQQSVMMVLAFGYLSRCLADCPLCLGLHICWVYGVWGSPQTIFQQSPQSLSCNLHFWVRVSPHPILTLVTEIHPPFFGVCGFGDCGDWLVWGLKSAKTAEISTFGKWGMRFWQSPL